MPTFGVIPKPAPVAGKKIPRAVVLTANRYEDFELYIPVFRLVEADWHVDIAAPAVERIVGEVGYTIVPDMRIDDVDPAAYDLLLIPGGFPTGAPTTVRNTPHALDVTRHFIAAQKPVAAICHGPYVLVSADVIRGRRLTSYWYDGVPEEIAAAGGTWIDEEVVVDGNLVTARWPMDIPAFTREMMRVAEAWVHRPQP